MANRTDPTAKNIRGTNPQNLVEKILRSKIYQHTYWKEQCFGLTAETLVDKAMELDHLGGTYGGNRKPTPFMCLVMKMLQIQPEKDIVVEFIKNEDYK
jgi:pre-mRNA-splicing factor 38A